MTPEGHEGQNTDENLTKKREEGYMKDGFGSEMDKIDVVGIENNKKKLGKRGQQTHKNKAGEDQCFSLTEHKEILTWMSNGSRQQMPLWKNPMD